MKKIYSLVLALIFAISANAQVVISQVYGAGGNGGAAYTHDYIELFNRGTSPVTLTDAYIQYAGASGSFSNKHAIPTVTIQPGQYYLIQEAGGTNGAALPTPDAVGTINLSATNGKVALTLDNVAPADPTAANVLDYVGFGTATTYEGTAAAPAPSATNAIFRTSNGCIDSNNNASDFAAALAAPRNTASPTNICTAPSLSTIPTSLDFGFINVTATSPAQTVTVTAANITTAPTYTISGADAAMFAATGTLTTSGGSLNVTYTPTSAGAKTATLTVTSGTLTSTVSLTGAGVTPGNPYNLNDSAPLGSLAENFESGTAGSTTMPNGWTNVAVQGDRTWEIRAFGGNKYAQATSYSGNGVYQTMLISPAVNLDQINKTNVTFDWNSGFANGAELKVYLIQLVGGVMQSTLLQTINDMTNTTGYGAAFTTVTLNLSAFSGNGFLAFEYNGEAGITTTTYQVDNVNMQSILAVSDITSVKSNFVKNTLVNDEIKFGSKADVKVYNMNGQVVKTASVSENKNLDAADLAPGMYIVTGTVNGEAVSQKILKK